MALCKGMKGKSEKKIGVKISSLEGSLPCRCLYVRDKIVHQLQGVRLHTCCCKKLGDRCLRADTSYRSSGEYRRKAGFALNFWQATRARISQSLDYFVEGLLPFCLARPPRLYFAHSTRSKNQRLGNLSRNSGDYNTKFLSFSCLIMVVFRLSSTY